MAGPVCPVCDSTEYVLRNGEYFCVVCNTQSQELGTETIMDDDTVPGGFQMCDRTYTNTSLRGKSKQEALRRKRLCEVMRWSSAEGFTRILRGWVSQLKTINVDVEVAVTQLWTLYLRQLKMGFERPFEENCMDHVNMHHREKINIIGGPPGLTAHTKLQRKRPILLSSEEEETEDDTSFSLKKRRRQKKKQKDYFKTLSEAGSSSEMNPTSPRRSSVSGRSSVSADNPDSDISEEGYLTDTDLLSHLLDKFYVRPGKDNYYQISDGDLKDFYAPVKLKHMETRKQERKLPTFLDLSNLASLLILAVVSRPGLSLTVSDLVRMFNSEALSWINSAAFIPPFYRLTGVEKRRYMGSQPMDTPVMSALVWRMASFLPKQKKKSSHKIILATSDPRKQSSSINSEFGRVLARILNDLSLPSDLSIDIMKTLKPLHLVNITSEILPYDPKNPRWLGQTLPNVTKRILALILFALKFHYSLDDQFEVYHSHNIKVIEGMQGLDSNSEKPFFDVQSWIRLSKLRLDYLMSSNYMARDQYRTLSNIGTPDLGLAGRMQRIRDISRKGFPSTSPDPKFKELTRLLKDLSVENVREDSVNLSLTPLMQNTQRILDDPNLDQNVKNGIKSLLDMTTCSLKQTSQYINSKLRSSGNFKEKQKIKLNLHKNYETNIGVSNITRNRNVESLKSSKEKVINKNTLSFCDEHLYGRNVEKTNYFSPNPKVQWKGKLVEVTKKYWMTSPIIGRNRRKFTGPRAMLDDVLLATLPDHFSWILKYFSLYALIPIGDLLDELLSIENIILDLDEDYFGYQKIAEVKKKRN